MDERDLEARIAVRLHRRFDHVEPADDFRARMVAAMLADRRPGRSLRSYAVLVAAAAVVVVVVAGLGLRTALTGPAAGPSASGSPVPASPAVATTITYQLVPIGSAAPDAGALATTVAILQDRLAATGVVGGAVRASGANEVVVDLPRIPDLDHVRSLLVTTGKLEFVPLPASVYGTSTSPGAQTAVEGQPLPTEEKPLFGGGEIAQAYAAQDQTGLPAVGFKLKDNAARLFADYTSASVGQFFAVVLDGVVLSVPYIAGPITGGTGVISGGSTGFSVAEMNNLVTVLNYGSLPFPLREVSMETPTGSPTGSPGR